MEITKGDAMSIEVIVSNALRCSHGDYCGFVNSDFYRKNPFEAVILCIGALNVNTDRKEILEFVDKWRTVFNYPEDNKEYTIEHFISEFSSIIALIKRVRD